MTLLYVTRYRLSDLGVIKLEEWPEGIVLWVGGEIVWKSWDRSPPDRIRDLLEANNRYLERARAAEARAAALEALLQPFADKGAYWASLMRGCGHITNGNELGDAAFEARAALALKVKP